MRIDSLPIAFVFAAAAAAVMGAIELGYRLGVARHARAEDEKESPVSVISGAILGLATFLLAFTFGIVSERHDAKKALVRDEAIAIGKAWRRADFLPEGDRAEAKELLRRYVEARLEYANARTLHPERLRGILAESQRTHDQLWAMAVENARRDMNSDVAAMYIDALNEVQALHTARVSIAIQARVPAEIWLMLIAITLLGMMGVGYQTGIAGSKRSLAKPILALCFALVITLIASLDRPDSGIMTVSQQPLMDLLATMAPSPSKGG